MFNLCQIEWFTRLSIVPYKTIGELLDLYALRRCIVDRFSHSKFQLLQTSEQINSPNIPIYLSFNHMKWHLTFERETPPNYVESSFTPV